MLKSKWGQSYPFNAKTGYDYSGCVATAVAQIDVLSSVAGFRDREKTNMW